MLKKPSVIPQNPGIYIFRDSHKKPLYIGKAANIKKRLVSYFQKNVSKRVLRLRTDARSTTFEELPTEFDALIREAELIKKYRPKFNILMRDDKSYFYVVFTQPLNPALSEKKSWVNTLRSRAGFAKETFPRIFITHKPAVFKTSDILGPFTEGRSLFAILKLLRKSFPYCTCKKSHKRRCVNADIGRCLGFCCMTDTTKNIKENIAVYKKNITAIKQILSGKTNAMLRDLKHAIKTAANKEEFERAAMLRNQYLNVQSIRSHRFIIEEKNPFILTHAKTAGYLQKLLKHRNPVIRIEGYDVSNISGIHAAASRVVFENGRPHKDEYKRFKIQYTGISDFDMLKEALKRRMVHKEWVLPDLILIDGGMPQLRAVANTIGSFFKTRNPKHWPFALVGLSKAKTALGRTKRKASGDEILTIYGGKRIQVKDISQDAMHLLQAIRDEAHRFAKTYHHILRRKAIML